MAKQKFPDVPSDDPFTEPSIDIPEPEVEVEPVSSPFSPPQVHIKLLGYSIEYFDENSIKLSNGAVIIAKGNKLCLV